MYADFEYYTGTYLGTLPAEEFPRLAARASEYMDYITLGRAKDFDDTGDVLKKACCALADTFYLNEHGGGIASESVGRHNVNYVAGISNTKNDDQRLYSIARRYLAGTGLLYRGIC